MILKNSLKKSLSLTGFVILSFLLPHPAIAALFSKVYVFGDSLSDTGRLYRLTQNTIPVSPPYAQKLSNGSLWVEYLQQSLGLIPDPNSNFALAGSTTGSTNTTIPTIFPGVTEPGVQQQVLGVLASAPVDPSALYVLWGGANDYLGGGQTNVSIPVNNLTSYITALYGVGARNFLVPNLPDLGKLPLTVAGPNSAFLSQLSVAHDIQLASALNSLAGSLPNSHIISLDILSLFSDVISHPSRYGLTNAQDACLPTNPLGVPAGQPCSNPNEYLFWDGIHPTTRGHQLIGQRAAQALGVPEPSLTWGLLTIGAIAVGSRLRKKAPKE